MHRTVRVAGPAAMLLAAGLSAGCSDPVTGTPRPAVRTAESSAPTRSPEPLEVRVQTRPGDCRLPALTIDHEVSGSLADHESTSPVPGLVLESLQDSARGDVDLRVTREVKGCAGRARLTGGGDQDVHVLGVSLHVFWPAADEKTGATTTAFHIAAR